MADWDGRGLPPAAQARLTRARDAHVATSLLEISGQCAVEGVGFDVVGEVMGCCVQHLGWGGYGCGYYSGVGSPARARTFTSSGGSRYSGYGPYVRALYGGYDTALHRLLLEAQALGADGVVGVTWTVQNLDTADNREFVAMGTAVRARTRSRPAVLFSTDLSGTDVAKAVHAGWVPTGAVVGIAVGVRHDDYQTRMQTRSWQAGNVEVTGYTELVTHVRADARAQFHTRAARVGGDAAVVSDMSLHVWGAEPGEGHRDHVAQSVVTGSALAKVHRGAGAPTDTLTVLPLRGTDRRGRP